MRDPESMARRLAMLGAGTDYARRLCEQGGDALVEHAVSVAETYYGRDVSARRELDALETAIYAACQARGLPTTLRYAGAGPFSGSAFDGVIPADTLCARLADDAAQWEAKAAFAEHRHRECAALLAEMTARCDELRESLRLARANRGRAA